MRRGVWLGLLLGLGPAAALGVGRFAYALVLPDMQRALNLSFAQAGVLGSANTAGYLLGALVSHRVLYATGYRRGFAASLGLQVLTLALLWATDSLTLLALLRFMQGVLGAFVFVGGAAMLLASGGLSGATGMYFGGVGIGILVSPVALASMAGWQSGWLLLAGLAAGLSLPALTVLPSLSEPQPPRPGEGGLGGIAGLLVAYGLYGAGYIGYMTFVTTGLEVPLAGFWLALGVGATLTGLVWGRLVESLGGRRALLLVILTLALSSVYPLVRFAPWLSALLFGVSFLGVITAITQVFRVLLPAGAWARAMGVSTAAFAIGQAIGPTLSGLAGDLAGGAAGALGMSTVLLFAALTVAALPELARAREGRRPRPPGAERSGRPPHSR